MKGKITRDWKRTYMLSELMENRSYMEVNERLITEQAGKLACHRPDGNSRRLDWIGKEACFMKP